MAAEIHAEGKKKGNERTGGLTSKMPLWENAAKKEICCEEK
jgi:hypothetical protein